MPLKQLSPHFFQAYFRQAGEAREVDGLLAQLERIGDYDPVARGFLIALAVNHSSLSSEEKLAFSLRITVEELKEAENIKVEILISRLNSPEIKGAHSEQWAYEEEHLRRFCGDKDLDVFNILRSMVVLYLVFYESYQEEDLGRQLGKL